MSGSDSGSGSGYFRFRVQAQDQVQARAQFQGAGYSTSASSKSLRLFGCDHRKPQWPERCIHIVEWSVVEHVSLYSVNSLVLLG